MGTGAVKLATLSGCAGAGRGADREADGKAEVGAGAETGLSIVAMSVDKVSTGERLKAQTRVMAVNPVAAAMSITQSLEKPLRDDRLRLVLAAVFLGLPPLLPPLFVEVEEREGLPLFFAVLPVIADPWAIGFAWVVNGAP